MEQIYHSSFGYHQKLKKSIVCRKVLLPIIIVVQICLNFLLWGACMGTRRRLHFSNMKTLFVETHIKITCFIKNYIKSTSIPAISRTWYVQTRGKENKHCRIAGTKKKVHLTITKAKIVGPRLKRNSNQNIILFVWKTGTDFGLFPKFQRPNQFS